MHDFSITKGDNTETTLQIDCSDIYTTARTGYTKGTFTQATVNLAVSGANKYYEKLDSTGGTLYYTSGGSYSHKTVTASVGTKLYTRSSSQFTVQGESITFGARYYIQHTSGTPSSGETWYTMSINKPSSGTYTACLVSKDNNATTTFYKASTTKKYEATGSGYTVTETTGTNIGSSSLRLTGPLTRYDVSTNSTTYYTKS